MVVLEVDNDNYLAVVIQRASILDISLAVDQTELRFDLDRYHCWFN